MRAALWLLALFAVAVASALIAGNNQAVVTVFWPPHRVDVSFNLVMVLLLGAFLLCQRDARDSPKYSGEARLNHNKLADLTGTERLSEE